jgi:protein-L-isoaspartate(D-aspartate) O-methyltransferase
MCHASHHCRRLAVQRKCNTSPWYTIRLGSHVLEIGTGSAFSTALLAQLAGEPGAVASVDVDPDMTVRAKELLARAGCDVALRCGDGQYGWVQRAPYDRLIAWCSVTNVPSAWLDQTVPGAILVIPTRAGTEQWIARYSRSDDALVEEERLPGAFIPLTPVPYRPWATER